MSPRVIRGCEPFRFDGGPIGFWVQHGFTGCPASMRPLGEWLAELGMTVVGPRLPGHGTSIDDLATTGWRDWHAEAEQAVEDLTARCSTVVGVAQSFGGAIALHIGAQRPDLLSGLALINPWVREPRLRFASLARPFMRTYPGTGRDIKKPGPEELNYDRIPVSVLPGVGKFLRMVEGELPSFHLPLLVFSSDDDHVVKPANSRLVMARAGSEQKELVRLANSYHVATLDFDAEMLFDRVLAFGRALEGTAPAGPA
jgi:carboxylesterase